MVISQETNLEVWIIIATFQYHANKLLCDCDTAQMFGRIFLKRAWIY